MLDLDHARQRMVDAHIARRGVRDERVLEAMRTVRREDFVEPGFEEFAYEDAPLPIAEGQTISQPFIVARMIEVAELDETDRVLEVGTGSGYAAAVMSLLVDKVFSIERHRALAQTAQRRLAAGGYGNVEIRTGDGTKGWPEAAPFDAILVAAGGPEVPEALKQQLAVGGRLIIPVGGRPGLQRLMRITRLDDHGFDREDLGGVMFVPLVGEQGWAEEGRQEVRERGRSLPQMIAAAAEELPDFDDPVFGEMFDRFGERRIVLLGEASHGTSEFYRARAAITRRLVEKFDFTIVAVEADWPDAASIDRAVRLRPERSDAESPFQRFPTWMWRNTDVLTFLQSLRSWNESRPDQKDHAGFYGLDIYNMSDSIAAVLRYLDKVDPRSAAVARERYGCLTPWQNDPATYGRAVLSENYQKCEAGVIAQCRDLLSRRLAYSAKDGDDFLDAAQSARLIASAEKYYRIMYYGGSESWNLRDRHMFETLEHVLAARGAGAKAVVWAHNSHIGDARHTEMGQRRDELNIGQLCRERFGDEAALIGFGTHSGSVACASEWGGPMEIKRIRESHPRSFEALCHEAGHKRFLLDMAADRALSAQLDAPRLERFIGVIYRPETEIASHYAEASLSRQFDAYVWFDMTTPVTPLPSAGDEAVGRVPDTYPFGL
jgi:protein-L-isoaspartate(D-aspartate) O-methyltransferase